MKYKIVLVVITVFIAVSCSYNLSSATLKWTQERANGSGDLRVSLCVLSTFKGDEIMCENKRFGCDATSSFKCTYGSSSDVISSGKCSERHFSRLVCTFTGTRLGDCYTQGANLHCANAYPDPCDSGVCNTVINELTLMFPQAICECKTVWHH